MTHHSLISCLTNLPIRSAKKQMELWTSQKQRFHRSDALIRSLGKPSITAAQAKRLVQLGLEHSTLVTLRSKSGTPEAFMEAPNRKGVKSKALHAYQASKSLFIAYLPSPSQQQPTVADVKPIVCAVSSLSVAYLVFRLPPTNNNKSLHSTYANWGVVLRLD